MAQRAITIFGGSGFIGRYVVQRLARRGWTIRVAVRHPRRAYYLKPLGDVGQITPVAAGVADPATVAAAVGGVDAVINLAGILHESGSQTFEAVHHQGAAMVAEAAAKAGVGALVHMSALGADSGSPSRYAKTKAAGEEAVRKAFPSATILRPSVLFGPEDDFFNRFAAMTRLSPVLPLVGGGTTKFQPVYVGDVADAVIAGLESANAGATYELGGPEVMSFRELMEVMLREIYRRRRLMSLSFGMAESMARFLELLPDPPLTRDQVALLRRDNVVSDEAKTLADLGIEPHTLAAILPTYLDRYRPGGRFTLRHAD